MKGNIALILNLLAGILLGSITFIVLGVFYFISSYGDFSSFFSGPNKSFLPAYTILFISILIGVTPISIQLARARKLNPTKIIFFAIMFSAISTALVYFVIFFSNSRGDSIQETKPRLIEKINEDDTNNGQRFYLQG